MTPPDYREQARALLRKHVGGEGLIEGLASWASRIAEEERARPKRCGIHGESPHVSACLACLTDDASALAEARLIIREALRKNGPRAHADLCGVVSDLPCDCWMCRARALTGEEGGR